VREESKTSGVPFGKPAKGFSFLAYNRLMSENASSPSLSNLLSEPRLWNEVAEAFSGSFARHLARFGEDALRLAQVGPGMRIADVACGPGMLSLAAAQLGATVTAIDFSPEMIALLRESARSEGARIDARVGDGMALPLAGASCDAAFSMFGLIFFPDRGKGFRELLRILAPGGRAVVGSWVPEERVPLRSDLNRTLCALVPDLPFASGNRPLGEPEEFRAEMAAAGFRGVEVHEVTHEFVSPSIDDYWNTMERGTAPYRAVREWVGPERWTEVRRKLIELLQAKWGTGPQRIPMIANLGMGFA
jgi:ubiquinone/menaquinone biosynthesis C-methylase UbiE